MDVHKKSVTACLITPKGKEVKTFSTMTDDLLKMLDWLMKEGCQQVAMESTSSYWKPVYNLLEAAKSMEVLCKSEKRLADSISWYRD